MQPSEGPVGLDWRSPSTLTRIAANLLPLLCVLVWRWPAFIVLVLYWLENWAYGLFTALRMLALRPAEASLWVGKLVMTAAFCLMFGLFTAVHGLFLFHMFGGMDFEYLLFGEWTLAEAKWYVRESGLWLAVTGIFASHLYGFVWDFLLRGEYRVANLDKLWDNGVFRIFILQLTIILSGLPVMLLGSPIWAVLIMVVLKLWLEVDPGLMTRMIVRWRTRS